MPAATSVVQDHGAGTWMLRADTTVINMSPAYLRGPWAPQEMGGWELCCGTRGRMGTNFSFILVISTRSLTRGLGRGSGAQVVTLLCPWSCLMDFVHVTRLSGRDLPSCLHRGPYVGECSDLPMPDLESLKSLPQDPHMRLPHTQSFQSLSGGYNRQ